MIRHYTIPVFLVACLLLGGASAAGFAANLMLQFVAIPIIGWSLWALIQRGIPNTIRAPLILLCLLIGIALVQLIPMPPAMWTALPGREPIVEGYQMLGVSLPWMPLSLAPHNSVASLLWLLPAFAVLLGIIVLGAFRGRAIAAVIVGVTLVSIVLGALQVLGGGAAYLYEVTNYGAAVGFFSNSNHNATLLLTSIPFLAALQKTMLRRHRSPRKASAVRLLGGGIYVVIFVGLLINASLAGIGLGVPVALVTWLIFGQQSIVLRRTVTAITFVATAAVLATIAIGPFGNNLFGAQTDNADVSRQVSFARTLDAAADFLPFGSGIGTFRSIYRTMEPIETVTRTYMNHAHSDWLELLLETGLIGMCWAALFLAWWGMRARAIWKANEREPFAQAATIASTAIMLHSLVDYPLRTAAISAVFALCVGLMSGIRPYVRSPQNSEQKSSARHLSI